MLESSKLITISVLSNNAQTSKSITDTSAGVYLWPGTGPAGETNALFPGKPWIFMEESITRDYDFINLLTSS